MFDLLGDLAAALLSEVLRAPSLRSGSVEWSSPSPPP